MTTTPSSRLRSRWSAIGAAIAVTCGAGGLAGVNALGDEPSAYVPVEITRIVDTRHQVGLDGPLTSDTCVNIQLTGTIEIINADGTLGIGDLVPHDATAVVVNATLVTPDTIGFLSLRDGGQADLPTTSHINATTPLSIEPNAVTVALPTSGNQAGQINAWYHGTQPGATAHLIIDIAGYFTPAPAGPPGPQGPQGIPGSKGANHSLAPEQVATLQWWNNPPVSATYPVGSNPTALAFDGENIWAAHYTWDGLTKLDRNGHIIDSFDLGDGNGRWGIAFDGTHIWTTNSVLDTLTKLDLDGNIVHEYQFPADTNPKGIAFDGTHIWVAEWSNDSISRFGLDGSHLGSTELAGADDPFDVVFDGANIWTANQGSANVSKLDTDGNLLDTFGVGAEPVAIRFDGAYLWTANFASQDVTRLGLNGAPAGTYPVGGAPSGLAFDGIHMWVSLSNSGDVVKLDAADGDVLHTYDFDGAMSSAIVFDGAYVWIASYQGNSLTKLNVG